MIDWSILKEIIDLGGTRSDAAREFKCCEKWVRVLAAEVGLRFPRRGRSWATPETRSHVILAMRGGAATCEQIARAIGNQKASVYATLAKMGADGIVRRVEVDRRGGRFELTKNWKSEV